jgi:1,4-alpha-glucan branching enzyme
VPRDDYRVGAPDAGAYVQLLSSDDADFGGSGYGTVLRAATEPVPWQGQGQSMRLRLPPLGVVVLAPVSD